MCMVCLFSGLVSSCGGGGGGGGAAISEDTANGENGEDSDAAGTTQSTYFFPLSARTGSVSFQGMSTAWGTMNMVLNVTNAGKSSTDSWRADVSGEVIINQMGIEYVAQVTGVFESVGSSGANSVTLNLNSTGSDEKLEIRDMQIVFDTVDDVAGLRHGSVKSIAAASVRARLRGDSFGDAIDFKCTDLLRQAAVTVTITK